MSDEEFYARCLECRWETNSPKQANIHAETKGHWIEKTWGDDNDDD